jgi:tRNA 2-thiouridine synthesizing protein D
LTEQTMKFAIALFSAAHAPSSRRALLFAQAALAGGHEIVRLFFYQDGVHSASGNIVTPQDEVDVARQWREFVTAHQLDSVVCIAAALRRGVLDEEEAQRYERSAVNLPAPWELSGLGQLHDAVQDADRLICFGGP